MSIVMSPAPSASGRPLNICCASSGQGSGSAATASPPQKVKLIAAAQARREIVVRMSNILFAGRAQASGADRASFPFELGECRRGVAGIILLEQRPAILFVLRGALRRGGQ